LKVPVSKQGYSAGIRTERRTS